MGKLETFFMQKYIAAPASMEYISQKQMAQKFTIMFKLEDKQKHLSTVGSMLLNKKMTAKWTTLFKF